jgi:outer membrane lipoprotein-sorting protein
MRIFKTGCLGSIYVLLFASAILHGEENPVAILNHARSVYAALSSYSDTGTVTKEYGASSKDKFSFATHFNRSPRGFMFDFTRPGGDHIVIWGDPDAFHVWWKATGQTSEYPNPSNTNALVLNDYPTSSVISKIPPLIYSKADLPGTIAHFQPTRLAGMEEVAGSKCYRLEGGASDSYGTTGRKVNFRNVTLWIDAGTYMVRKIIEDAPAAPGQVNRSTTEFDPQANPKLSADVFKFSPPK